MATAAAQKGPLLIRQGVGQELVGVGLDLVKVESGQLEYASSRHCGFRDDGLKPGVIRGVRRLPGAQAIESGRQLHRGVHGFTSSMVAVVKVPSVFRAAILFLDPHDGNLDAFAFDHDFLHAGQFVGHFLKSIRLRITIARAPERIGNALHPL